MFRRILYVGVAVGSALSGYSSLRADLGQPEEARLWSPGDEWKVSVKVYSRGWMLDFSDPTQERLKNIPRVQYEYHLTIRVAGVEEQNGTAHAHLEFLPDEDAPKHIVGERYVVTIDMETMRVVHAKCTQGDGMKGGTLAPLSTDSGQDVHGALFARAYLPVDWVIEGADKDRNGVECVILRRAPEAGAKRRWEQVRPTDLAKETPHTYGTEFRRTVTPTADPEVIKVIVSTRGSFQEKPAYEVEQIWDNKVGWWRSFTRRIDGHLDLEATLITD